MFSLLEKQTGYLWLNFIGAMLTIVLSSPTIVSSSERKKANVKSMINKKILQ
jgi:hypothetical protein